MTHAAAGVRILRALTRPAMPWRNGGGITREIAASPPGATLADFDWRVSMAEITEPGPFSRFENVDRVLTVLAGTLHLAIEGQAGVVLNDEAAPYAFPGDAACWGETRGGPVTDLNVMVRHGHAGSRVWRTQPGSVSFSAPTWLFVALAAGQAMTLDKTHALNVHDAILAQRTADYEISVNCPGLAIELHFVP